MGAHLTTFQGSITDAIRSAIEAKLPGATVDVTGGGGHYTLVVTSAVFAGKRPVESQRLVYGAIAHLMAGSDAPVHAIDSLKTLVP